MNAILHLADVPHSVISTGNCPTTTADQQRQRLQPEQVRRPPRGAASSPRRTVSGSNHWRNGVRPLSTDTRTHLQARSATPSPLRDKPARLSFRVERMAQTLDRLERAASDFDLRLLAEKSMTLPKSDGHGARRSSGFQRVKSGGASDGDDIDTSAARFSRKRLKHFRFKNLFRSSDKSSDTTKASRGKVLTRKKWESCM